MSARREGKRRAPRQSTPAKELKYAFQLPVSAEFRRTDERLGGRILKLMPFQCMPKLVVAQAQRRGRRTLVETIAP